MKSLLLTIISFTFLFCNVNTNNKQLSVQNPVQENEITLEVSPYINQKSEINQKLIKTLSEFFKTRKDSHIENKYWLPFDFEQFIYPYFDISEYCYGGGKYGDFIFYPSLMEIIKTKSPDKWILKIAFMENDTKTQQHTVLGIYNIIAQQIDENIYLSRFVNYATEQWKIIKTEYITYKISPQKNPNQSEILQQETDIKELLTFFDTDPIHITYYSCKNPKELFEIKGFDYHLMMYSNDTGGLAENGNIIFSGNNSEIYTHEIAHIYIMNLFPNKNIFLDEGLATYIGGSGGNNYLWHREKMKSFFNETPDFRFDQYNDPYGVYFKNETPVLYMISALICERTIRLYGKEKLFELFDTKADLWDLLEKVGLNKDNINEELRKEITLSPLLF